MDLLDLNDLHINSKHKRPNLSPIDIDINNDIDDPNLILLPIFKGVYLNDVELIKEYADTNYIEMNLKSQTPLMLAAKLNNYKIVKLLLNESCLIDCDQKKALDYAEQYNASIEIIDLLSQREFCLN